MEPEVSPRHRPDFALSYLLPTERCVVAVRYHPAKVLKPAAITLAGLFVVFVLDTFLPAIPKVRDVLWFAWFGLVAWLAWKLAEWWTDYFIVTDRRLMLTTGLITRHVNTMPLAKVTDMSYQRPLIGRVLGYGVFVMESAGQDQALSKVPFVPEPDLIYLEICDLLFGPKDPADGQSGA